MTGRQGSPHFVLETGYWSVSRRTNPDDGGSYPDLGMGCIGSQIRLIQTSLVSKCTTLKMALSVFTNLGSVLARKNSLPVIYGIVARGRGQAVHQSGSISLDPEQPSCENGVKRPTPNKENNAQQQAAEGYKNLGEDASQGLPERDSTIDGPPGEYLAQGDLAITARRHRVPTGVTRIGTPRTR